MIILLLMVSWVGVYDIVCFFFLPLWDCEWVGIPILKWRCFHFFL